MEFKGQNSVKEQVCCATQMVDAAFNVYESIVRKYIDSEKIDSSKWIKVKCPDQYAGIIGRMRFRDDFDRKTLDYRRTILDQLPKTVEGYVILILESPHKEEFKSLKDGEYAPIGPACGKSGCAIRHYFEKIFGKSYSGYGLVLVNAIQFQCSLGIGTWNDNIKNDIFKMLFKEPVLKKNFQDRLRELVVAIKDAQKHLTVINACTSASGGNKAIKSMLPQIVIGEGVDVYNGIYHPCCWCDKWEKVRVKVKGNN